MTGSVRLARYHGLGVAGHVVGALERMGILGPVLRHKPVEDGPHVTAHVGVGVLIDAKPARGVLYKQVEQALPRQRRQLCHDLARDEVKAPRTGAELDFCLSYSHGLLFCGCKISQKSVTAMLRLNDFWALWDNVWRVTPF